MVGVTALLPWAMFTTAIPFYSDYKLNYKQVNNITEPAKSKRVADYSHFFVNYLGIVAQAPNLVMALLSLLVFGSNSVRRKMHISFGVIVLHIFLILMFAVIDSSSWPEAFFGVTLFLALTIQATAGFFQNCTWASVGDLPFRFANSINIGLSLAGLVAALTSIIAKLAISDDYYAKTTHISVSQYRKMGLVYFLLSLFIGSLTWTLFADLPFIRFYRYYHRISEKLRKKEKSMKMEVKDLGTIWRATWRIQIIISFLQVVTLTCYPGLQVGIRPQPSFSIPIFFQDIMTFLLFNISALLGNLMGIKVKCPGPKFTWIFVVLRIVFIPLFLFCNFLPKERNAPVWIENDYVPGILSFMLGFTHGYFITIMIEQVAQAALNAKLNARMTLKLAGVTIISGVFLGILVSLLAAKLMTLK